MTIDASALLDWYEENARDLPWRRPETPPWSILVSEIMLQQTPVHRVLPVYQAWLTRWPTPGALANDAPGEAIRVWGRLGYPRRALRLHECANVITQQHRGDVPTSIDELLALPGIGTYTARAVAAFAFQQRQPVVDVNVRRVLARVIHGQAEPGPATTQRDLALMENLLPLSSSDAARMSAATMELGALVCTSRSPQCDRCPVRVCAWRAAGCPDYAGPRRPPQGYEGTDRQARGRLLAVLRRTLGPVSKRVLDRAWPNEQQRDRAIASLLHDGLMVKVDDDFALPG